MVIKYKNGEEFYNKIYLYFNAIIALSLAPFGYLLLLRQSGQLLPLNLGATQLFILVFLLLVVMSLLTFSAHINFEKAVKEMDVNLSLRKKLDVYFSLSMNKYLSFLLVGMLGVAGLYTTANSLFIVAYIISVMLLSFKRPTLDDIINHLKMSAEEEKILIDKTEIK